MGRRGPSAGRSGERSTQIRGVQLTPRVRQLLNRYVEAWLGKHVGETRGSLAVRLNYKGGGAALTNILNEDTPGAVKGLPPDKMAALCQEIGLDYWQVLPLSDIQIRALSALDRIAKAHPQGVEPILAGLEQAADGAEAVALVNKIRNGEPDGLPVKSSLPPLLPPAPKKRRA